MIYKILVKHTSLLILRALFFVYLIDVLGVRQVHADERAPNFWSPVYVWKQQWQEFLLDDKFKCFMVIY